MALKAVDSYEDAFGDAVSVGDKIVYYSGNTGRLEEAVVKSIKTELIERAYTTYARRRYLIRTEAGGTINSGSITMKI